MSGENLIEQRTTKFGGKTVKPVLLLICIMIIVITIIITRLVVHNGTESHQVGVILPLSGNLGYVGKMEGDGMRLAAEDINNKGGINGIPIELLFDDSQGKPDIGVTAAQKMMNFDNVKIVIASISSVVLGLKPVVERNGGILIGCCMHPSFFKNSPTVFRFYEGVEDEAKGFVDYLTSLPSTVERPRLGILYVEVPNVLEQIEDYIRPGIEEADLDFVFMEPYRLSDKEFKDKVLKIRAANLTHLVVLGYGFLYPNIFRELKEQKVLPSVQIVGGWGFLYPQLDDEDLEGVVVVGPNYVFSQPQDVRDFYARFKESFGYEANFDAAMSYAALQLLVEGMKGCADPQDTSTLSQILGEQKQVPTIVGKTSVDSSGGATFEISWGTFKNGRLVSARLINDNNRNRK